MQEPYRRKRPEGLNFLEAQAEAHKIAFYPMLFQAVRAMLNFGILEALAENRKEGLSRDEIMSRCQISDYACKLLLEVAEQADIVLESGGIYRPSKLGIYLLEDKSVRCNMDFMHDVCYQGAFYLEDSLKSGRPEGLKVFGDWETLYQGLSKLPEKAHKSWFDFDNFYSDLAFDEAVSVVLKSRPTLVYDIGGNTARFDLTVLKADDAVRVKIFDLAPQLEKARDTLSRAGFLQRAELCPIDMLDDAAVIPAGADAIWMSQFLDCFSPEQIVGILSKLARAMSPETRLFILEPFVDQQEKVSALALLNTSLYFTCMANGYSRMYKQTDMLDFAGQAGLKCLNAHQNIGKMNYTLLECALG